MSTVSKINPAVRENRHIRKHCRRRLKQEAEQWFQMGKPVEGFKLLAVLEDVRYQSDHFEFCTHLYHRLGVHTHMAGIGPEQTALENLYTYGVGRHG